MCPALRDPPTTRCNNTAIKARQDGRTGQNYKTPPRVDTCVEQTKSYPPSGEQSSDCLPGEPQWFGGTKFNQETLKPIKSLPEVADDWRVGWITVYCGMHNAHFSKLQGLAHRKRWINYLMVIGQCKYCIISSQLIVGFSESEKPINIFLWTILGSILDLTWWQFKSFKIHSLATIGGFAINPSSGWNTDQKLWLLS